MNFLAHLYLSGEEEEIMVGNFIGDYVKGRNYHEYPLAIQEGILLHRNIDSFTDTHPLFREAKKKVVDTYGLHSGIVIDLLYDHYLAKNWVRYSSYKLRDFTRRSHAVLLSHFFHLPKRVKGFLPFLIQHKRLESYSHQEGILKTLEIMSRYTSLPEHSAFVRQLLKDEDNYFEENFDRFISDMVQFVQTNYSIRIPGAVSQSTGDYASISK